MKRIKDLAVKIGSYTSNGQEKARWKNIGAIMEGDNGQFIFLDRSFNPAGVPFKDGSESIIVSVFDIKDKDGAKPASQQNPQASKPVEDEIPF